MRTESGGMVTEAEMAAPIDDPGSDGADASAELRRSKDPCCLEKYKLLVINIIEIICK